MDERDGAGTLGLDEEAEISGAGTASRIAEQKPSVLSRLQEKKDLISASLDKAAKSRMPEPAL